MEWYYGNEADLIVPKHQGRLLDRLPSPDSWSQWGVAKFENSDSPKKNLSGKSLYEEVSRDEYQLNDAAEINQMDDIFLSSLLEEDNRTTYKHLHGSSSFSAEPNYNMMMSAGNYITDMMGEMEYMNTGVGSSRFSPSVNWENGDVATTSCLHVSRGRNVEGEKSPEESVLKELERVTSQLTEQTRTCFRDALYRLAENSKQQTMDMNHNGGRMAEEDDDLMMDDCETLRLGKTEATESKTNAIDRAIANLMFKKVEHFSVEDLSATSSSVNFDQEEANNAIDATNGEYNYIQNHAILSDDAQVPNFNQQNQHRDFSGAIAFSNVLSYC